jgi:hypothetical protein
VLACRLFHELVITMEGAGELKKSREKREREKMIKKRSLSSFPLHRSLYEGVPKLISCSGTSLYVSDEKAERAGERREKSREEKEKK